MMWIHTSLFLNPMTPAFFRQRFAAVLFGILTVAVASAVAQTTSTASSGVTLDAVSSFEALHDGMAVHAGPATLHITALRDDILRIRVSPSDTLPEDASWAVLAESRAKSVEVQPTQDAAFVGFRTAALDVRVEKDPLRIIVRDLNGNVISADAAGRPVRFQVGGFSVYKEMPGGEHYFGLGDKTGSFDRRQQAYTLWNTDIGPQESTDPLYKAIPFYLAINGTRSYGIFLDNTWHTWFDFGKQARDAVAFGSEGGPLDYYFIYGPTPKQVVEGYAYLTGKPPLPPLWALGFQQSRYSYTPESQVREIATRLRNDRIPSDVIYLDIDYQDRNRPFTVNPKTFPNFPGLVSDLHKQHFHLVNITDLHIAHAPNQGYAPYDSGHEGDHFVKNPDGSEFVGVVWPGPAVFPDFTRAQTREWWGGLYQQFVKDGVGGFWNDMNEPSVFDGPGMTMPLNTVHRIEEPGFATRAATHAEIHNAFGLENARATYEGLLKLRPDERPFVLTRATYAGGQRYGFTWTGDNAATWNHLRLATQMVLNLGISGIPFVGADVGGFGSSPASDLTTRWVELAAFSPFCRDHAAKGTMPHELWANGAGPEAVRRRYIETRYKLLPYFYTLAEESSRTGLPMMRPVFLEFPEVFSTGFDHLDTEFLLGPSLLVAPPPFAETLDSYAVSLPAGSWYDFWTGEKMAAQPTAPSIAEIAKAGAGAKFPVPRTIHPPLETMPVYARGGSILPFQPLIQNTDEIPSGPLELRVYPGAPCSGSIYLDDGHTFAYQHGAYLRQTFNCKSDEHSVHLTFHKREGSYTPWWKFIEVVVYDWPSAHAEAKFSSSTYPLKTTYDAKQHALHMTLSDVTGDAELSIKGRSGH
ncbi:MAG TPA: glycoside hydrolase family 31 protein [Candidatus Dormibacteraeota bacterium]|nr:glycoside hydrolase family 31 protein [Candidatus Dormibacteraeota bacterium]